MLSISRVGRVSLGRRGFLSNDFDVKEEFIASFKILDKCFRLGTFYIGFDYPPQALLLLCPSFGLLELSAEFYKLLFHPNTTLVMFVIVQFLRPCRRVTTPAA